MNVSSPSQAGKKSDFGHVLRALEEFCATLASGERIPTRSELMRRFNASERTVMRALDELRRAGVITARTGAGTYVTGVRGGRGSAGGAAAVATTRRMVMAIGAHDYSFFDRCMHLLLRQADAADLTLVCQLLEPEADPLATTPDMERAVGAVLFSYRFAPLARRLQQAGQRVVLVGAPPADVTPDVPCVFTDHEQSGYLAVRHLVDLGHRHIAFTDEANLQSTLRWQGNQRALREAQRRGPVKSSILPLAEVQRWQSEPSLALDYFAAPGAPTGVVVWNDHQALTLLGVLQRAGIRVPQQVSVVGHDDLPEGRLMYPALTTIGPGTEQLLHAALSILIRPVAVPRSHTVVVLPTFLGRDSSGSAPLLDEKPLL